MDVKREYPAAQIDGFDISFAQCPPPEWLPDGVRLRELDLYEPLPAELEGIYDVVHLRLFFVVIRNDDPGPVLRNMLRMLSESCLFFACFASFHGLFLTFRLRNERARWVAAMVGTQLRVVVGAVGGRPGDPRLGRDDELDETNGFGTVSNGPRTHN